MAYISKITDLNGSTYDLKSKVTNGILYGEVDSTSTATAFTAQIPGITEYYDGLTILLRNGVVTSASGFTIDINDLGGKPSYNNMTLGNPITPTNPTRDTTIFNINYAMIFVYNTTVVDTGCWICYRGYDANTNTLGYQLRTNSYILKTISRTRYYRLLFTSADNTHWVPANTTYDNSATSVKTPNPVPINPFGEIVYLGNSTSYLAEADVSATAIWQQYTFALGYSFNTTGAALTLTTRKPVYVKCAPQSDGSAIIDSTTPYVQELPSTDDGKIYILLGMAYSATSIELLMNHPVYYYKDGAVRLWTNNTAGSSITVDSVLDPSSSNPVENQAIYNGIQGAKLQTFDIGTGDDFNVNTNWNVNTVYNRSLPETLVRNILTASRYNNNVCCVLKSSQTRPVPDIYDPMDRLFTDTGSSALVFYLYSISGYDEGSLDPLRGQAYFRAILNSSTSTKQICIGYLKVYLTNTADVSTARAEMFFTISPYPEKTIVLYGSSDPGATTDDITTQNLDIAEAIAGRNLSEIFFTDSDGFALYSISHANLFTGQVDIFRVRDSVIDSCTLQYDANTGELSGHIYHYDTNYTFDSTPTQNSTNPVTSGGVYNAIANAKKQIFDIGTVNDFGIGTNAYPNTSYSRDISSDLGYDIFYAAKNNLNVCCKLNKYEIPGTGGLSYIYPPWVYDPIDGFYFGANDCLLFDLVSYDDNQDVYFKTFLLPTGSNDQIPIGMLSIHRVSSSRVTATIEFINTTSSFKTIALYTDPNGSSNLDVTTSGLVLVDFYTRNIEQVFFIDRNTGGIYRIVGVDTTNLRVYISLTQGSIMSSCVLQYNSTTHELSGHIYNHEVVEYSFDTHPISGSNNLLSSGTIYTALQGKQDTLTFDATPTFGSSNVLSSGTIYDALDSKQDSLTLDTIPTSGSTNPITSGGVYDVIGDIETLLAAI